MGNKINWKLDLHLDFVVLSDPAICGNFNKNLLVHTNQDKLLKCIGLHI